MKDYFFNWKFYYTVFFFLFFLTRINHDGYFAHSVGVDGECGKKITKGSVVGSSLLTD